MLFYNLTTLLLRFGKILAQKHLGKFKGNIVVWVKITTLVRLGDLDCHAYKNKHMVKITITREGFVP